MASPGKRIPLHVFKEELLSDLPSLILKHPRGIYIADLSDWYGESLQRVQKACTELAEEHKILYLKSARRAFYVLPLGHKPIDYFPELSQLQGRLMVFVLQQHRLKHLSITQPITTSYAALAKALDASYGGVRSVVQRCHDLRYIQVIGSPSRGLQESLVIQPQFETLRWTINPPQVLLPPTTTPSAIRSHADGP